MVQKTVTVPLQYHWLIIRDIKLKTFILETHTQPCGPDATKDNYHNCPINIAVYGILLWLILLFPMFLLKHLKFIIIELGKC